MNCKEGDLAVVVRDNCGSLGKIVRCIRLFESARWLNFDDTQYSSPTWLVDTVAPDGDGALIPYFEDRNLRPLRDNPGEDETLTWAPRKEPVAA